MALLTCRIPIDYSAQQGKRPNSRAPHHANPFLSSAAFEDFLSNYKSTVSELDLAVQDLNIDGDGTSDEYDFMDDVTAGGKEARQQQSDGQYGAPRRKYMDLLQKVADRELDEVTIELDDLDNVRSKHRESRQE